MQEIEKWQTNMFKVKYSNTWTISQKYFLHTKVCNHKTWLKQIEIIDYETVPLSTHSKNKNYFKFPNVTNQEWWIPIRHK